MSRLMNWLSRLIGLQSLVESEVEAAVRLNTALAGAVARAEACKEAEQYAAELEKTHPQLAAGLRHKVAEELTRLTGGSPPAAPAAELPAAVPAPALPETAVKKGGRPKAALAAVEPPTGGQ